MAITRKEFDEIAISKGLVQDGDQYLIVGTDIRLQYESEYGKKSQAVARGFVTGEVVTEFLNMLSAQGQYDPSLAGEVERTQDYIRLFAYKQLLERTKLPRGLSDMFPPEDSDQPKEVYSRLPIPNVAAVAHFITVARAVNHVVVFDTITK